MKRFAAWLALLLLCTSIHAAQPGDKPTATTPQAPRPQLSLDFTGICPSPYEKLTQGIDTSKGEYYCLKANVGCPAGFTGAMDSVTGKLSCTPVITAQCPVGWSGGAVDGKLVCNSIPQPLVACPKNTKDWQWGTSYAKNSWNRMGCFANLKPAF